jgi:hypothetical protein
VAGAAAVEAILTAVAFISTLRVVSTCCPLVVDLMLGASGTTAVFVSFDLQAPRPLVLR